MQIDEHRLELALAEMQQTARSCSPSTFAMDLWKRCNTIANQHAVILSGFGWDGETLNVDLSLSSAVLSTYDMHIIHTEDLPYKRLSRIMHAVHGDVLGTFIANRIKHMQKVHGAAKPQSVYIARSDVQDSIEYVYNTISQHVPIGAYHFNYNNKTIDVYIALIN